MAPELTFARIISLLIPGFAQLVDRRLPKAADIVLIQAFLIYPIYHQVDTLSVIGLIAYPVLWIYSAVDAISTHNFPIVTKDETVFLYSQVVSLVLIFGILLEILVLLSFLFTALSPQSGQQLSQTFPIDLQEQSFPKSSEGLEGEKVKSGRGNPVSNDPQANMVVTSSDVDLTQVSTRTEIQENVFGTDDKTMVEKPDFVVVVATFDSRQRADRQMRDLAGNPNTEIKAVGEKYLVIVTGFDTEAEAQVEQGKHLEEFKDCYIARFKNPAVRISF